LKNRIEKEKSELAEVENKINQLQAKYQLKKIEIDGLKSKYEEKTKLVNEARTAYKKVLNNLYR
jgi:predicted  nucleic acid-binding Zn-ribbon protein